MPLRVKYHKSEPGNFIKSDPPKDKKKSLIFLFIIFNSEAFASYFDNISVMDYSINNS
jgi:hypothetical protein